MTSYKVSGNQASAIISLAPAEYQGPTAPVMFSFDDATQTGGTLLVPDSAESVFDPIVANVKASSGPIVIPPTVPSSVALWRAKAVLYGTAFTPSSAQPSVQALLASCTTLGAAADVLVAAQNNHALSAFWVSAGDIYRSSAALAQIAGLLNLSSATIDALFIAAEDIPPL